MTGGKLAVVGSAFARIVVGAFLGGVILGVIGFSVGFFGPMIFMPDANQGPLIGIFMTGPLGVITGAVIGGFVGWRRGAPPPPV